MTETVFCIGAVKAAAFVARPPKRQATDDGAEVISGQSTEMIPFRLEEDCVCIDVGENPVSVRIPCRIGVLPVEMTVGETQCLTKSVAGGQTVHIYLLNPMGADVIETVLRCGEAERKIRFRFSSPLVFQTTSLKHVWSQNLRGFDIESTLFVLDCVTPGETRKPAHNAYVMGRPKAQRFETTR